MSLVRIQPAQLFARMVEWYTRRSQKPLGLRPWGFKSPSWHCSLASSSNVGHNTLDVVIGVQIPTRQLGKGHGEVEQVHREIGKHIWLTTGDCGFKSRCLVPNRSCLMPFQDSLSSPGSSTVGSSAVLIMRRSWVRFPPARLR